MYGKTTKSRNGSIGNISGIFIPAASSKSFNLAKLPSCITISHQFVVKDVRLNNLAIADFAAVANSNNIKE